VPRVAIFGGSFNPPHVAHQLVALYVLETAPVDELWLVPAFRHAMGKPLAPFEDRLRMTELAAAALGPRVRVSDVERVIGGESRTIRTLSHLRQANPGHTFSVVIGADLLPELPSWQGGDELRRTVPFIVVGRGGVETDGPAASGLEMPPVSSSDVRRRLAAGEPVDALVPRTVVAYISQHGLYRP
jgi:nicotinate-nucleotide adenylyltransferase